MLSACIQIAAKGQTMKCNRLEAIDAYHVVAMPTSCQRRTPSHVRVIRYCFPVASWKVEWKLHLSRWLLIRGSGDDCQRSDSLRGTTLNIISEMSSKLWTKVCSRESKLAKSIDGLRRCAPAPLSQTKSIGPPRTSKSKGTLR